MAVSNIKVSFKCENKFLLYALYPIWVLQVLFGIGIRDLIFIDKVIKVSVND